MSTPRSLLDNGADADDDHDVKNDSDDDADADDRKPMPMFCLQCKQHSDVTKRSNRNTPLSEPCEYHPLNRHNLRYEPHPRLFST